MDSSAFVAGGYLIRNVDDDATSTLSPGRLLSSQKQLALYDYMAEVIIRDVG